MTISQLYAGPKDGKLHPIGGFEIASWQDLPNPPNLADNVPEYGHSI